MVFVVPLQYLCPSQPCKMLPEALWRLHHARALRCQEWQACACESGEPKENRCEWWDRSGTLFLAWGEETHDDTCIGIQKGFQWISYQMYICVSWVLYLLTYLLQVSHPKATQDILKFEQNLKMMSKKSSHLPGGFTFLVLRLLSTKHWK